MQIMQNPQRGFWGFTKYSVSGKTETHPEKMSFVYIFFNPNSTGRMPERRLTFNPGFKPGTKLVRMPDSSLKLVHMPEGGLTLDPRLAPWIKAQKIILL